MMNKELFNEIFIALIGTDTDEYGEKYTSVYKWGIADFKDEFIEKINTLEKFYHINEEIISAMLITNFEDICGLLNNEIDYIKLYGVSKKILDIFTNNNK